MLKNSKMNHYNCRTVQWLTIFLDYLASQLETRSSWLNCALRDDEAVYWVSIGHYEAVGWDGMGFTVGMVSPPL